MHISSSYAKILGEKLFRTREIPGSGSKSEDGEKKKRKKKERLNNGNNNGQAMHFVEVGQTQKRKKKEAKLRMVHASKHGAHNPPGPKK